MGKKVEVKVDLERREKLRRLHTVTHIINFCARKVLGSHVWQNGSNLKVEFGTLDITHYDGLTQSEIFEIERLANETIFENKKVSVEELDRTEAENKYGFGLYQGGAIPMKTLRVVSVLDSDIEACGGIHMLSTGGIGFVKIVSASKIQDGVIRLKYVVREFAEEFINSKQEILSGISSVFSVEDSSLVKTSQKFFDEWKGQKKEIDYLKKELKSSFVSSILASNLPEFEIKGDYDMGFLMEVFTSVFPKVSSFKLVSDKFVIASGDLENVVSDFKKEIKKGKFSIYIL